MDAAEPVETSGVAGPPDQPVEGVDVGDIEQPDKKRKSGNLVLRIGLASALGVGALVTGFILTRPGRKLMGDVLAGRKRTPLEGRVLDALWGDRLLGRRELEVLELGPGKVALIGVVENWEEVGRAVTLAERTKGVKEVESRLETSLGKPPSRK
jgi:hypothetical protein